MKNEYEKYSARREINPAFILNQVGKTALTRAKSEKKYIGLNVITAQLMCSFTIEAVLNHIGYKISTNYSQEEFPWKDIERMQPKDKLAIIADKIGINIDFKEFPFNEFKSLFTFRDQFVHGKTEVFISEDIIENQIDEDNFPFINKIEDIKTKWEKNNTINKAESWRKAVYKMSEMLSEKAKCYDPVMLGDFIDTYGKLKKEDT